MTRATNEPRGGRRAVAKLNAMAVRRAWQFKPTVVLSMHVRCSGAAWLISRLLGARWVQYYHAKEIAAFGAASKVAVRAADAHIAVSTYTAELAARAGANPDLITIVPPAVGKPATSVAPAPEDAATDSSTPAASTSGGPTILSVSRMADAYKGHDVIIDALPAILSAIPDAHWVVIGDGKLREGLQTLVAARGLSERVAFAGFVDDAALEHHLISADVFVLPSRVPPDGLGGEGFGIVYLEAAARGLPVVAGNEGGATDAVEAGRTGLLVDPSDAAAVSAAVIELLTNHELRTAMSQRGPEWAANFSWDRLATDVRRVLSPGPA